MLFSVVSMLFSVIPPGSGDAACTINEIMI